MVRKGSDKKSKAKKNEDLKRTNKASKKSENAAILPGEDDLETVLAQFFSKLALQNSKFNPEKSAPTTEESLANLSDSGVPSPRLYASFVSHPLPNQRELYLFGGEYFNGKISSFYADFYRYLIDKKEWRQILPSSPPPPPPIDPTKNTTKSTLSKCNINDSSWPGPRSSHQMVGMNNSEGGALWMFGGEFSSTKESQFHHYRDLWRFRLKQRRWEQIIFLKKSNKLPHCSPSSLTATKPECPSARSGHRMVAWRHYLILFGGFYDNYFDMKYYNDLWAFDTKNLFWTKLVGDDASTIRNWPASRSGFLFLTFPGDDVIFLHGGYVKKANEEGQPLSDSYILHLSESKCPGSLKAVWEKVRIQGLHMNSEISRSGMSAVVYKSKAFIFGGVSDQQIPGSKSPPLTSFYNDLTVIHLKSKRAHRVILSRKNQQSKSSLSNKPSSKNSKSDKYVDLNIPLRLREFSDDEYFSEEDDRYLGLESKHPNVDVQESTNLGSKAGDLYTAIHPRYNAMMAIQGSDIFLYGGKYEQECVQAETASSSSNSDSDNSDSSCSDSEDVDVREWTMDDLYKLTVDRWDSGGWECLQGSTAENQKWFESKEDDEADKLHTNIKHKVKYLSSSSSECESECESSNDENVGEAYEPSIDATIASEPLFMPVLPKEPLREYATRSMDYWLHLTKLDNSKACRSLKELRSDAFSLAKAYYESTNLPINEEDAADNKPSHKNVPTKSVSGDSVARKIR